MALTDNLVAYYKFNNDVNDSVGTNHGTATSITYETGKIDQSTKYNGSTSAVAVPSGVYSSFGNNNSYTFTAWVKVSSLATFQTIFNTNISASTNGYGRGLTLYISQTSGVLNFFRGNFASSTYTTLATTQTISLNTWTFVCATYNGSTMSLSINNGTPVTAASTLSASVPGLGDFGIWKEAGSTYHKMAGNIDEAAIWTRALTSTEITEMYNAGAGNQYPFSGGGGPTNNFMPFFLAHHG